MGIVKTFQRELHKKVLRGWDKIYVFVDVHDTILHSTYDNSVLDHYYGYAIETLRILSEREDICLGLYTCSYPDQIEKYLKKFKADGINFEHVNTNNDEPNNKYACFDQKPYFNVLIDDKAGFDPQTDWKILFEFFNEE